MSGVLNDPFVWLEDIEGEKQLAWVRDRNDEALARLGGERFEAIRREVLAVLDSPEKLPEVDKRGSYLYDLWRDERHERGVWRRTTPKSFAAEEPEWEVVLDLDELATREGVGWVWAGAVSLPPAHDRALVHLSRGGADANVVREFDLLSKRFVEDGFWLPESKGVARWADHTGDALIVTRDFGEGSLTTSGYPRIVKLWRRGEALADARALFTAEASDMGVWAWHDFTPGYERTVLQRAITFYEREFYLVGDEGVEHELTRLDLPLSCEPAFHREWLLLTLKEPWSTGGTTFEAGSLAATRLDSFLAGGREFETLFSPTPSTHLDGVALTRSHVVLNLLDDVKGRLEVLTPGPAGWGRKAVGLPQAAGHGAGTSLPAEPLSLTARSVDAQHDDAVWVTSQGFLTPTTLSRLDVASDGSSTLSVLKRSPELFDASGLVVEQRFVSSDDGTRVPYFQVGPVDARGARPTHLYAYGGFEVPLLPVYSGAIGRAWLARGGTYVMANIRGGGEYGPDWHRSALKQNRHLAYEDLAAVAKDLLHRGVTTRERLSVRGGSNGGLLVGNMLTRYPELFGAVVCQVPLLDMKRYSHLLAGASWTAEYGDPDDPAEWEFIKTFSPYHLLEGGSDYPPVLFTTSTRDDRVHPGHARKMAARMLKDGDDVTYYENVEGGHGGAATNAQAALMQALVWEFCWARLGEAEAE